MSPVASAICAWLLSQPAPPITWATTTTSAPVELVTLQSWPTRTICPVHGPLRAGWERLDVIRFVSHDGRSTRQACFRCVVAAIERSGCIPELEELNP